MIISSKTTYLLPTLFLLATCYYISFVSFEFVTEIRMVSTPFFMYIIFPLLFSIILFSFFKIIAKYSSIKNLKYLLFIIPLLMIKILIYFTKGEYDFGTFLSLVAGSLLYYSYYEFFYRCSGFLFDDKLVFKNIFGGKQEIKLIDVVKLEQKFNLLGIFKELKFLNFSKKTIVTYQKGSREYNIKFFARIGRGDKIFDNIKLNARKNENYNIKIYGY